MNTEKFTGKASIYEKYRPEYPKAFIDYLYRDMGFNTSSVIADIGSGTGIMSKQLLDRGSIVYGVEPNEDMRKKAENTLNHYGNYTSIAGTAENTMLSDKFADFITVAQAFHWFDVIAFKRECARILKPEGLVVLVWNSRVVDSAQVMENAEVCKKYCPEFKGFSGGTEGMTERISDFFNSSYQELCFENNISYDLEGFIGRNLSASYAPTEKQPGFDEFVKAIIKLFDKYSVNGRLTLPNLTRCYIGKVLNG